MPGDHKEVTQAMTENDVCDRCDHVRRSHRSYNEGGCGSRVRVGKRVRICGCQEFQEPEAIPVVLVSDPAAATDEQWLVSGLA